MKIPHKLYEIKKEITRIEAIDTLNEPIDYLKSAVDSLMKGMWTPYFGRPDNFGFELWRARKGQWSSVKDLWYPPSEYITKLGRMNKRHDPVFYSCFGHNAKLGSLEEIRSKKGEVITQICCDLPQQTPMLKILSLGHADRWMEEKLPEYYKSTFRYNREQLKISTGSYHEYRKNEEIKDWVNSLFVKRISEGNEHQYSHTIAIAKSYFDGFGCDGILFPSVASEDKAINLVLTAKAADRFVVPIRARIVEIVDIVDEGYVLKLKNESEIIDSSGNIIWKW